MNTYEKNYLKLKSLYNFNILKKSSLDEDIIINLGGRVINIFLDHIPSYIKDRLQLTEVNAILIRHTLDNKNSLATIHFLRVIDLNSSLLNFVVDLENIEIIVEEENNQINFYLKKTNS